MDPRQGSNTNFPTTFKDKVADMVEWERRISGGWKNLLRTLVLYDAPALWQKEIPIDSICFELDKPMYQIYGEKLKR
jgi:hypothetical protein